MKRLHPIKTLKKVAKKTAYARSACFAEAHVIMALEKMDKNGSVGRLRLSRALQLGEGEARTLVKHLKNEGIIQVSQSGISLSIVGRKLLSNLRTYIGEEIEIPPTSLTVGSFNVAVRVTGASGSVKFGLEQRDAAILAGAKGATTLIFSKGKLIMPGTEEDVSKSDPAIRYALANLCPKEGDIIIIGTADENIKAELGAKAAALNALGS